MNSNNSKNNDHGLMVTKKHEAKRLYIIEKITAKQISERIDVSEKSIGRWVKQYGWNAEREGTLRGNTAIEEFIKFLKVKYPPLSVQFDIYAKEYYNYQRFINQAIQ